MSVVLDASMALAWCFPDETSSRADAVLASLGTETVLVPPVWALEIASAALVGERRNRLTESDLLKFLTLLRALSIVEDAQGVSQRIDDVLPIARRFGLSAYDASYLDLAIRRRAALATLDEKLESAPLAAPECLFCLDV